MNKMLKSCVIAALVTGCSGARVPDRIEVLYTQPIVEEYIVAPGDTIGKIAAKFGIKPETLAEANRLPRPYKITVGDILKVNSPDDDTITVKQIFYN